MRTTTSQFLLTFELSLSLTCRETVHSKQLPNRLERWGSNMTQSRSLWAVLPLVLCSQFEYCTYIEFKRFVHMLLFCPKNAYNFLQNIEKSDQIQQWNPNKSQLYQLSMRVPWSEDFEKIFFHGDINISSMLTWFMKTYCSVIKSQAGKYLRWCQFILHPK